MFISNSSSEHGELAVRIDDLVTESTSGEIGTLGDVEQFITGRADQGTVEERP